MDLLNYEFREKVKSLFLEGGREKIDVISYKLTDSTNTRAREFAEENKPSYPMVFVADEQNAGRGRRGKSFNSAAGVGLYFSLLLPLSDEQPDITELTVRAAVSLRRAIFSLSGLDTKIKWVNDIYSNSRKLAGILAEGVFDAENGKFSHAVIGIGVNLKKRAFPEEILNIATTLEDECGQVLERERLILEFTRDILANHEYSSVISEYRENLLTINSEVDVKELSGVEYSAYVEGITERGALIVRLPRGERKELISAEVSIKIKNGQL